VQICGFRPALLCKSEEWRILGKVFSLRSPRLCALRGFGHSGEKLFYYEGHEGHEVLKRKI
jgi:hypothetical protein